MRVYEEKDFIKGWFIGDFNPSLFKTNHFETAIKRYKKFDCEDTHYHEIATEITFIVYGSVLMNGVKYIQGDIVVIEPKEYTDFLALEDSCTAVIKIPCVKSDKYLGEYDK